MPTTTKKNWTLLVYLAGDNDLDAAGVNDLEEMKMVGSTPDVNVVAQFDRQGANSSTNRYFLRQGGALAADQVAALGETNTGDPRTLEDFIAWGAQTYPANHYLLVIWNHGAGWDDTDIYRAVDCDRQMPLSRRGVVRGAVATAPPAAVPLGRIRAMSSKRFRHALFRTTITQGACNRAIAYDDNAKDFLDNLEMKRVLMAAKRTLKQNIDILGMDACLMNMAEVAWQIRDSVGLTVGSEETEPGDGWPYDRILRTLTQTPGMTGPQLGALIVKEYLASYPASEAVTQSALDLGKAGGLIQAVDGLATALCNSFTEPAVKAAVIAARCQAQAYYVPDYIDLVDFCQLVQQQTPCAAVNTACQAVIAAAQTEKFILASGYKHKSMAHSHGVSIYFPTRQISPLYAKLDFAKKTAWRTWLATYVDTLARRPE